MLGKEKRKVRVYIQDGPTIEGVLVGRSKGHYILWAPRFVTADENRPTVEVSGHVEIPRERVLYYIVVG